MDSLLGFLYVVLDILRQEEDVENGGLADKIDSFQNSI